MISWRWFIGIVTLGVLELLVVVKLHQRFDLKMLVTIYLATTLIGFIFLKLMERQFYENKKTSKKTHKKLRHKIKNKKILTEYEIQQFKFELTIMYFLLAFVLVIIPGLITDLLGVVLVFPGLLNRLIEKSIEHYQQNASENKNSS